MAEPPSPCAPQGGTAPPPAEPPPEVECPICYQEYNRFGKRPRMLECLHVFCTDCLQRIQRSPPSPPDPRGPPPALSCPLCRHPTPLASGDALALPCNSRILALLAPPLVCVPAAAAACVTAATARVTAATQRVVLSLGVGGASCRGETTAHFLVLPSVSLRVERMHPGGGAARGGAGGVAPGLMGEAEVIRQHRRTLVCVQLMALAFWGLFVATCVVGVVFGPGFFHD